MRERAGGGDRDKNRGARVTQPQPVLEGGTGVDDRAEDRDAQGTAHLPEGAEHAAGRAEMAGHAVEDQRGYGGLVFRPSSA